MSHIYVFLFDAEGRIGAGGPLIWHVPAIYQKLRGAVVHSICPLAAT